MDHAELVRRATGGDVKAFMELTRRFQHFAFGSALALVHDFQKAEDVVQEAFLAAWSALPSLAEPAAFPGWLRGIVRHQAFRVLRRGEPRAMPLAEAERLASEEPAADRQVEQRQQAAIVLAAVADLPDALREPALLFFVHECSHQDVATFLDLSLTTVNNRLHAARARLKERMLTMMSETLQSRALPDDFANRIGRLIASRGHVVDALFDPAAMPDLLAELAVSDEANRRAVNVQVAQRRLDGTVRGIALVAADALRRGSTVLNSGRHAQNAIDPAAFESVMHSLAGPAPTPDNQAKLLETGIKVIDVMCPLVAGGTLVIAGDPGAGIVVVMEELVRRLGGGRDRLTMFVMSPAPSPEWPRPLEPGFSYADELKKEGFSEGTVGAVQTFFLRAADGPWTSERLAMLAAADVVLRLSRERARAKVYPTVDVLASRSRLLGTQALGDDHATIAGRVREALAGLWIDGARAASGAEAQIRERALKLQNYFTQPFYCAEPYTKRHGVTVSVAEALATCRDILDGRYDALPTEAFFFSGGMTEIERNIGRELAFGPVTLTG